MTDALDLIWAAFDTPDAQFGLEARHSLPHLAFGALVEMGLLVPAESASHIACPICPDRHVEEVETRIGPDNSIRYYISCPTSLRVEIQEEELLQWQPDFSSLARKVRELLGIDGRCRERVNGQLWRLGEVKWKNQPRDVFIARGLSWPSQNNVVARQVGQSRSIVLIGLISPPPRCWPDTVPAVVPLPAVVDIVGDQLALDLPLLHRMVEEADAAAGQSGLIAEIQLRKTIDRLVEQRLAEGPVNELLRAFDAQGMSSREIEMELSKRGIDLDHASICRRLSKTSRPGGKSSRSILRDASSQPRNKNGTPIYEAEPSEDE